MDTPAYPTLEWEQSQLLARQPVLVAPSQRLAAGMLMSSRSLSVNNTPEALSKTTHTNILSFLLTLTYREV